MQLALRRNNIYIYISILTNSFTHLEYYLIFFHYAHLKLPEWYCWPIFICLQENFARFVGLNSCQNISHRQPVLKFLWYFPGLIVKISCLLQTSLSLANCEKKILQSSSTQIKVDLQFPNDSKIIALCFFYIKVVWDTPILWHTFYQYKQ